MKRKKKINDDLLFDSLFSSPKPIDSHSWFDINHFEKTINRSSTPKINHKSNNMKTFCFEIFFNDEQKFYIDKWMNQCINIYNITNRHIKNYFDFDCIGSKENGNVVNFISLRKTLDTKIKNVCAISKLNKHTADYAVKHCVEMWKSAISNHKKSNKKFNIRKLKENKRMKSIVIEPASVSKKYNTFFMRILGKNIDSNIKFIGKIKKNSLLHYDSYKGKYLLIHPYEEENELEMNKNDKCGIDIGVRTFLTTFSENDCYEIGTKTYAKIDKINNKLDKLAKHKDEKKIKNKDYKKLRIKYYERLRNVVSDMHNKSAKFLLSKYKTILIGNVSTKKMISNLEGDLRKITKRRLMALSHYKYRMKLKSMSNKYGCEIIEVSEYLTSKTCCRCGNKKDDLGANKIYECDKCKLKIDRDINASVNIYKDDI